MAKYKYDYDSLSDSLFIYQEESKISGSIDVGDLVLDYNSKEEFVGIELLNASSLIRELTGEKKVKSFLKNLAGCDLKTQNKKGILTIIVILKDEAVESRTIRCPFIIPDQNYESPAFV